MNGTGHLLELDALRNQVADLSRNLAERDRALHEQRRGIEREMHDLREQSARLRTIVEGTAAQIGQEFVETLVTHLTTALQVEYAIIAEIQGGREKKIRTLAVSAGGALVDTFEYDLTATPCASALEQASACFDRDVRALFPEFQRLAHLGIEGYCGVPLCTKSGAVVGVLVVMDTKPLPHGDDLQSLLKVFAPRVAAELERRRTEAELQRQRKHLVEAQALAHLGSWDWDIDGGAVQWSDEQFRIFGHEPGATAVTYDTVLASLHPDDHDRVLAAMNDSLVKGTTYDLEYRVVRPNGEVRTVHGRGDVCRDNTGHPIRMAGTCLDITDRTRAEKALVESETRFRTMADAAPVMIWIAGYDKLCTYFNKSWLTYTGRAIEQELGNGWAEGVHPDDFTQCLRTYCEAFARRESFQMEYRLKKADGTYGWILDHGVPLSQENGTCTTYVGTCLDVTMHKRIEEALPGNEIQFRTIFERAAVSMALIETSTGRFVHVNRRLCEIVGLSEPEMLANTFMAITYPEDLQADLDNMQHLIAGDICSFTMEKRHVRRDGSVVWGNLTVLPLWMPGQNPDYHLAVMEDITARKQAEEALRTSQGRLRQALQASSTGLWDWNTDTNEVSLSREWKRQLGYEEAELADDFETWETRLHPDDHARAIAYLRAYFAKPVGDYQQEFRLRHKDGTYRWIEAHASFVTEPDGRRVHLLGSHTDITARKHMEEALRISEDRYARATAVGKVGVWEFDVKGAIYHGDANLKALFGYASDELSTDPYAWLDLVHPDDRPVARATWEKIMFGVMDIYHYELRMLRKDGMVIWTEVRGYGVRDQDGRLTHLIGTIVDITERKEAENALAASERQLRTVLDALPVGVWFTDQSGKPVLANPTAKKIWSNVKEVGLRTGDNRSCRWKPAEAVSAPHRWALSQVSTAGAPSVNETLDLECLDGTRKTIRSTTVPVKDEDAVVIGAIVLNEDITSLRQAEEALKLTKYSVDHAVEGFFWISPDARILNVNDAACRMLEYSREELTAMTLHDIDPNFPPEAWLAHWEELKQKGSLTFESRHWSNTGRVLDTEVTVNYLLYDGREYNCAIMRDISERKRTGAALRTSEELFAKAFRASPNPIVITEVETERCLDVNEACLELFGVHRQEVVGHTTLLLTIWPNPRDRAGLIERLRAGRPIRNLEMSFRVKSGELRHILVSAELIDLHGKPCMVTVGLDITEQKRAEEELHQREQDLRHALEERERISEDLHDGILQSLYAVGLGLEACKPLIAPQQQNRKKDASKLMVVFNQAIGQLNHVMAEVRNFIAGLESQVLQGGDFSTALRTMVETMSASCRVMIEEAAARQISTEQAFHLMNVMREALSNSLRHGQAKRTTVSLKQLTRSVRLSVTDDGVGFNPATAHGVGHGLTNMAARAQKIGGRFAVRSKPGQGTKILLDLPKETNYAHN